MSKIFRRATKKRRRRPTAAKPKTAHAVFVKAVGDRKFFDHLTKNPEAALKKKKIELPPGELAKLKRGLSYKHVEVSVNQRQVLRKLLATKGSLKKKAIKTLLEWEFEWVGAGTKTRS